jgi:hypothetical protein
MSRAIHVLWTIMPLTPPQPWRICSRCNQSRPYRCSGKFRLNANGKRLDAWLIFNCVSCDDSWNHPIIERRATNAVEPEFLAAFQANDPSFVHRFAFDVAALRKRSHKVEEFAEMAVEKQLLDATATSNPALTISLVTPIAVSIRLDRLLAGELGLSRSRIESLASSGSLNASTALNKPVRNGSHVRIDLRGEGAERIAKAAGAACD